MHRIGADQEQSRSGALEPRGSFRELDACRGPIGPALHRGDLVEVHAVQQ